MIYEISAEDAPSLGDIREACAGDTVHLMPDWREREDWTRYLDAVAHAMARGAVIQQGDDLV
ncbi:hypothetical protein [Streptomyces uncialis]|uniref:hypothetical protein n=1 Tax=Streptomyces uncialis TaxID=1048205 RepID=UPI00225A06AB|nr:hypothetical protein [Streptomyces uncialis]MCX4663369.1 hypothetical protein [Streptomyces uncialis]